MKVSSSKTAESYCTCRDTKEPQTGVEKNENKSFKINS